MSIDTKITDSGALKTIAMRLERFIDAHPKDLSSLAWALVTFTDTTFVRVQHKDKSDSFPELKTTTDDNEIIKLATRDRALVCFLKKYFINPDHMEDPESVPYQTWNTEFGKLENYKSGKDGKTTYYYVTGMYRVTMERNARHGTGFKWSSFSGKRALYHNHRTAFERHELAESLSLDQVYSAIKQMKEGQVPSIFSKQEEDLSVDAVLNGLPLPEVTDDEIQDMVAAVEPNSYGDISKFGLTLTLEFSKALRAISAHFIKHAARPAHTFERTEEITIAVRNIDGAALVPAMPTGINKLTGRFVRVRLVSPEQNPLHQASELAKDLPDLAEVDSALYGDDLRLAEHAIKLSVAYADVMRRMHAAFVADKDRIVSPNSSATAEQLALAGIPEAFEKTASALTMKEKFLNVQAGNFGNLASRLGDSMRNLGGAVILSQAIQTPALQAIHLYNIYQAKRLGAFGRAVNDAVLNQLNLNETAIMGRGSLSRQDVLDEISHAGEAMQSQVLGLVQMLIGDLDERVKIAERIEHDVTEDALGISSSLDPS